MTVWLTMSFPPGRGEVMAFGVDTTLERDQYLTGWRNWLRVGLGVREEEGGINAQKGQSFLPFSLSRSTQPFIWVFSLPFEHLSDLNTYIITHLVSKAENAWLWKILTYGTIQNAHLDAAFDSFPNYNILFSSKMVKDFSCQGWPFLAPSTTVNSSWRQFSGGSPRVRS